MSKVMLVVESPAKAKTISKFLGRKYAVKASMGHVRDLPKSQFGVDVENDFTVKYINIRGKGDLIKELRTAGQKSDKILLATDPDREGEAIAQHLQEILKIPDGEKCRIEFNEITKKAVTEAVKKPREINKDLFEAQQTRRVLDRIVGYKLSPLLWRKIKRGLSAGRVQSVVVRIICDREDEINSFNPEEYWSLTAKLAKDKAVVSAKLSKIEGKKAELKNEEQVEGILKDIAKKNFIVEKINTRRQKRNPTPPFTTSSLQQEAYRKLNFSAKKTMLVAQQLYEGIELSKEEGSVGLVTYIRTDSTRISEEAKDEALAYISEKYGKEYSSKEQSKPVSKGRIQNAHECIRPTVINREPDSIKQYLKNDQYKLYKLIFERFIASQMSPAQFDITTADLSVDKYVFRATGKTMVFPGFTVIYIEGRDEKESEEDNMLPPLAEKEELKVIKLEPKQHFTQPPPRYTEATLIKTLEEKGIGRPSTYAPILDTIVSRGYVQKRQKQYYPTELGELVVDLLKEYFQEIIDIRFTANMEDKLDDIEEGKHEWKKVLRDFCSSFYQALEKAENEIGRIDITDEESDVDCEKCGRRMVIKSGRYGKFLACPGFPECRNAKPILEEIGVDCPECEDGKVVVRYSKKGRRFFGCSNYPRCTFVSWDEPAGSKCPECGAMLFVKRSQKTGDKLVCSNKECGFRQEITS